MSFNPFLQKYSYLFLSVTLMFSGVAATAQFPIKNLNVVIFTADDLGPDGVGPGAFGGKMKDLTPNIDRIANASVRFKNAYVNSAICMPSRGILATGRYGFNSHHQGFFHAPDSIPTLMQSFKNAGYKTGILGKVYHSSATDANVWDYLYDEQDLGTGRSPSLYYDKTKAFVARCQKESKPFYFMINSHDPHRPYQQPEGKLLPGAEWPSRFFSAAESYVPGFLPVLPEVKEEMSHYYNSVRRLDDTFGKVIQALKDAGAEKNTLVIFLSDNGIAMPFSKANCYLKATKTPFFFYLPGVLQPASEEKNIISTVDLFPTIMEMIGGQSPQGLDGTSFMDIVKGKKRKGPNEVYTQIDYLFSNRYPMRSVQDTRFGYIFNPWSTGKLEYHNDNEGETFKAMETAGKTNPQIQERVEMFRFRVPEEFYDLQKDPDCLHNLINDKAYTKKIAEYKNRLAEWMKKYHDPTLPVFTSISNPTEMQRLLELVYTTTLKPGKFEQSSWLKKFDEMKKHNFE